MGYSLVMISVLSMVTAFPLASSLSPSQSLPFVSYAQAYQVRAQNGHRAAMRHYRQLLLHNPHDTSAAARIAAADDSMNILSKVGWGSYSQLEEHSRMQPIGCDWEDDVEKLNAVLESSNYRHSSLRELVFNLPIEITDDEDSPYPMGPTYARPLFAGECLDWPKSSALDSDTGWLCSLRCLTALFLLSSSVPKKIFMESIIGGGETLQLMMRLGIVFLFDEKKELNDGLMMETKLDEEWVVPVVHLFPLELPPIRSTASGVRGSTDINKRKNMVLMTDLHPNVLGVTSHDPIEKLQHVDRTANTREGAVMYIGPDSLALVQHLHASLLNLIESSTKPRSFRRVLDVCTGSGVQALTALAMLDSQSTDSPLLASSAVAVDINERALRFTTFNAHLNGYKDRVRTVHADIRSGTVYRHSNKRNENDGELEGEKGSLLVSMILEQLAENDFSKNVQCSEEELKFDLLLANPPFIPVPPSRLDCAPSSLLELNRDDTYIRSSSPRYGLFSSGGANGEDCLCAILRLAPSIVKSDGGLLAVVSEFMNPPPLSYSPTESESELISRIENWWNIEGDATTTVATTASGILFTNENAVYADVYAERRAVKHDMDDIHVWKDHLIKSGVSSVSPGLLFVQRNINSSKRNTGKDLMVRHYHVPKTKNGSIWTPHNFEAVQYTRNKLVDWLSQVKKSL